MGPGTPNYSVDPGPLKWYLDPKMLKWDQGLLIYFY